MLVHFMMIIMCPLFTTILSLGSSTSTLEAVSNSSSSSSMIISKPNCSSTCGDVTIPYPFGIGNDTGCSLDHTFYVTCDTSETPPKLFLESSNVEIYNISDSELRLKTGVSSRCYDRNGRVSYEYDWWTNLRTFSFSEKKNMFTVIGCDDYALITGKEGDKFSSGCIGLCGAAVNSTSSNPHQRGDAHLSPVVNASVDGEYCSGNGCCQTSIRKGLQYYNVTLKSFRNHTDIWDVNKCGYAFLGEVSNFKFLGARDLSYHSGLEKRVKANVQVVIDWFIGNHQNCTGDQPTECKENSQCYDVEGGGYRCKCNPGYEGNPYLDQGCQDINECADAGTYPCYGVCNNTPGSYDCTCPSGSVGNATKEKGCEQVRGSNRIIYILGFGLALPLMVIGSLGLYFMALERKLAKLREKYYEQNGGALLKDKLKTRGGVDVSSMYIYRVEELQKATDDFAESKVIGKGGNGTVYQGTLTDERVVAIKKSQRVDEGQREEFINEMVILTQINHINVVQLIGFCLETEVPLLVYEFVSNGTLHRHIHNNVRTGTKRLSWDTRLRIAHESAGALAYLHTDARMSIIHRDVKSTNILLDENCTAKIADFGASRLVPLGHDEVTTLVQGTLGYLDPEYFHTGHLTDRSDVYSFGVVLAELVTGQQPLSVEKCPEERNLATSFVKAVKENKFLDILEDGVVKEAGYEQLKAISSLVCRCLNQVGGNRPGMKEVTMELDALRKLGKPTNWVSEGNYDETSSHMIEMEQTDPDTLPPMPTSDTIGDSF